MKYSKGNIFYKILYDKEMKQRCVAFETSHMVVIHDIHPRASYHYLILTKSLKVHMIEASMIELHECFYLIKRIWEIYEYGGLARGYQIKINGLQAGSQEIPHIHVHLMLFE